MLVIEGGLFFFLFVLYCGLRFPLDPLALMG